MPKAASPDTTGRERLSRRALLTASVATLAGTAIAAAPAVAFSGPPSADPVFAAIKAHVEARARCDVLDARVQEIKTQMGPKAVQRARIRVGSIIGAWGKPDRPHLVYSHEEIDRLLDAHEKWRAPEFIDRDRQTFHARLTAAEEERRKRWDAAGLTEAWEAVQEAEAAYNAAYDVLLGTRPTSVAGLQALAAHLAEHLHLGKPSACEICLMEMEALVSAIRGLRGELGA